MPLEHFVGSFGLDAVALAIKLDATGTIVPVAYVCRAQRIAEQTLPPHPLTPSRAPSTCASSGRA